MEYILLLLIPIFMYISRKSNLGWSAPTEDDIKWAEEHSEEIERNS